MNDARKISVQNPLGGHGVRFVSADVEIDVSSDIPSRLSDRKDPEFQRKRLFLKQLVEGARNLYHYQKNGIEQFFFNVCDGAVKQLVYKRYFTDHAKVDVAKNTTFRLQRWENVKCGDTKIDQIRKVDYTAKDFMDYFDYVNQCNGGTSSKKATMSKGSFNLKGAVFLGMHSFGISSNNTNKDFGSKPYWSLGIEAEYMFPFWNDKWSVNIEPSFNSFESENQDDGIDLEYRYIAVTAGFRHYFFITEDTRIFANAAVNYTETLGDGEISFSDPRPDHSPYTIGNSLNLAFGAGVNYQRFYFEIRLYMKSNPTPYGSVNYDYRNHAVIARYRFL